MSPNYQDWCYLNEEGMTTYGGIFPDRQVPIVSLVPILFEHPQLEEPKRAYLLRGSELTEEQIEKLIEKSSQKFEDINKQEMKSDILNNKVPVREELTSGAGTKRIFMYMPDYGFGLDEWEEEEEEIDYDTYDPCW